jgi:hypothetical protein
MSDKKEMSTAERGARANIDPATLRDMVQIAPYDARSDLAAFRFSHSPCGIIPRESTIEAAPAPRPAASAFVPFVNPDNPKHPVSGVDLLDRQMAAEADREAKAAAAPSTTEKMLEVMQGVLQQQSEILKLVAEQKE